MNKGKAKKKQKANRGWFKPGPDARRSQYKLSTEDCKKGYAAAFAKCSQDWDKLAWFLYRVRGHYRAGKRCALASQTPTQQT